jgi:hypothetical protein
MGCIFLFSCKSSIILHELKINNMSQLLNFIDINTDKIYRKFHGKCY